ncbi:reverse transcriptase domain-containing protein [Tanacetum coccineum]
MYERCFRNLNVNIRSKLRRCRAPMVGFLGETYQPLGVIDLRVTMGWAGRSKTVLMEFAIIKCRSPYNVIIGRTRMRSLGAIAKKGAKFMEGGEQVQETLDANEGGAFNLNKKLQAKSTLTLRAWRLYLGKETIEEGSSVRIILVSPEERMHSYAIHLKFNTSDHVINCEALLVGLAASVSKGMKDLDVFMDSPKLVAQTEGNHTPAKKQERKYKKEIMDATTPFHMFRITHLPKILNSKAEVLTGLATIKLEFLNQEVSVGIKIRPSVEETSSSKKGKAASNVPGAKPNYNWEASGSN